MADTISKIIAYYAHHEVKPETRERVLKRLATTKDDSVATETYQKLWKEIEVENNICINVRGKNDFCYHAIIRFLTKITPPVIQN